MIFNERTMVISGGIFEMIGMAGSLILCFSAIPQLIRTYRTKRVGDLSICYLCILLLGIILVMLYSLYIRNFIFIVSNGLSLFMTGMLMAMWVRYRRVD